MHISFRRFICLLSISSLILLLGIAQKSLAQDASTTNLLVNGSFDGSSGWQFSTYGGAAARAAFNGNAKIRIADPGTKDWHVELKQHTFDWEQDRTYRLNFSLRCNQERLVRTIFVDAARNVELEAVEHMCSPSATTADALFTAPISTSGRVKFTFGGDATTATIDNAGLYAIDTVDPAISPSGVAVPQGDLAQFRQIFADDFESDVALGDFPNAVADQWGAYPWPWPDTSNFGTYDPAGVISIEGGVMKLHLHTEDGTARVAAPYPLLGNGDSENGQLYGRYAIRFRADPVEGYKTAWLLWPDSETWPRDGEIDFPEGSLQETISAFMHRQDGVAGNDQDAYQTTTTYEQWHTAVIEWTSDYLRFILDGTVIGESSERIPNTEMHYVIQTETECCRAGVTPPPTDAQGDVEIDWVAVWEYTGQ